MSSSGVHEGVPQVSSASRRPRATILDVAAEAGVSRQTVTRALNDLPDVSVRTRERVRAAAARLRYRPNRSAQSLVKGDTTTVGLVVDQLANPYSAELAGALGRSAAARGWTLVLAELGADPASIERTASSVIERVDALVVLGCRDATLRALPRGQGPCSPVPRVVLDADPHLAGADAAVRIDHTSATRVAVEHLRSRGRRHIAYLASQDAAADRVAAYTRLCGQAAVLVAQESFAGGRQAAAALLGLQPRPDAVLAYNDVMALGLMAGLGEAGTAVPRDVAVVGVDGLLAGEWVSPALSTLDIDVDAVAAAAFLLLDGLLTTGTAPGGAGGPIIPKLLARQSS